jgi:hypothetical protein
MKVLFFAKVGWPITACLGCVAVVDEEGAVGFATAVTGVT